MNLHFNLLGFGVFFYSFSDFISKSQTWLCPIHYSQFHTLSTCRFLTHPASTHTIAVWSRKLFSFVLSRNVCCKSKTPDVCINSYTLSWIQIEIDVLQVFFFIFYISIYFKTLSNVILDLAKEEYYSKIPHLLQPYL